MSIKQCVSLRVTVLCCPNFLSFCSRKQILKFPSLIRDGFTLYFNAQRGDSLNDSTDKINSHLGAVALAGSTSHTGCTQALWCELGVRSGGLELAYMYHSSATAASKSLQRRSKKRQDKPGDELASAENWRFHTMPQICFIWFAD